MAPGIAWFGRSSSRPREKSSKDKTGKDKANKDKAGKERSKLIERALLDDRKRLEREVKILLLGSFLCPLPAIDIRNKGDRANGRLTIGAGDSGKSTIIKQMRILHQGGFDDEEKRAWKNTIFHNLVDAFLEILEIMQAEEREVHDPDNVSRIQLHG
jgi:guanine nucleotide-binding protein subunit alpha